MQRPSRGLAELTRRHKGRSIIASNAYNGSNRTATWKVNESEGERERRRKRKRERFAASLVGEWNEIKERNNAIGESSGEQRKREGRVAHRDALSSGKKAWYTCWWPRLIPNCAWWHRVLGGETAERFLPLVPPPRTRERGSSKREKRRTCVVLKHPEKHTGLSRIRTKIHGPRSRVVSSTTILSPG